MGKGSGFCHSRPSLVPSSGGTSSLSHAERQGANQARGAGNGSTWQFKSKWGMRGELHLTRLIRSCVEDIRAGRKDESAKLINSHVRELETHRVGGQWQLAFRPPQDPKNKPEWAVARIGDSWLACSWSVLEQVALRSPSRAPDNSDTLSVAEILQAAPKPPTEDDEEKLKRDVEEKFSAPHFGDKLADYDLRFPMPQSLGSTPAGEFLWTLTQDGSVTAEVKTELSACNTGNYYSETQRLTRDALKRQDQATKAGVKLEAADFTDDDYEDSALFISNAPWYGVVMGKAIVLMPTSKLKAHTKDKGRGTPGGDWGRSRGHLIPVAELLDLASERKGFDDDDYESDFDESQDSHEPVYDEEDGAHDPEEVDAFFALAERLEAEQAAMKAKTS